MHVFGTDLLLDRKERIRRFSEEALELMQSAGMDKAEVIRTMEHVYSRPAGELSQEVAGCGSTLMTLCEAHDYDFLRLVDEEVTRVESLPVEHFRAKHVIKVNAGISKPSAKLGTV